MAERLTVYFACSIRGEQGGKEEKALLVKTIKDLGHDVISEIFVEMNMNKNQLDDGFTPEKIYRQDMDWVDQSDIVVADVTRISIGVGMEIGWKLRSGGRVVALCQEDRFDPLTNMIKGCTEPNFSLHSWRGLEYPEDIRSILEKELGKVNG